MAVEAFNDDSFRDSVSHIDQEGHRVFFYPKQPSGRLYKWRTVVSLAFLAVFFALPFIQHKGEPIFLLNVLERKFILFGVRFWPQDFFLFVVGMIIFIVFIALFTVVYGRVFCGWVCPQTVFMEMVFRRIEYWIDGDAQQQRLLKKMSWNAEKLRKRITKIAVFFLIAVVVANTFLAYLIGVKELYKIVTEPFAMHVGGFLAMIIFSAVFFFVYYWFREQACLVVCPYGRMQGVLLDKHSIVVAYDHKRGEPRGKSGKERASGLGDCVDCGACVRVCPTGIDIRHGTQLECTNCTACIDACDDIMEKVEKPRGLIRYASEDNIATGRKLRWTPRMLAYTGILILLITTESFLLATRSDLDTTIIRARGILFQTEKDGRISNLYNVKIINKTSEDKSIELVVNGGEGEVRFVGEKPFVKAGSYVDAQFFILLPPNALHQQKNKLTVEVMSNGHALEMEKTTFLGPGRLHHEP